MYCLAPETYSEIRTKFNPWTEKASSLQSWVNSTEKSNLVEHYLQHSNKKFNLGIQIPLFNFLHCIALKKLKLSRSCPACSLRIIYRISSYSFLPWIDSSPWIVSSSNVRKLFKFSLHKGKLNEETIWNFQAFMNSKKNSCRGNYMRKYGIWFIYILFLINLQIGKLVNCMKKVLEKPGLQILHVEQD